MGRKMGLFGILVVILLYFASGVLIVRISNLLEEHFPNIPYLREYLIAGLVAVLGFLYWFVVARIASKSLKKLILG